MSRNGPFCTRSATMSSTASSPTPLTPAMPKMTCSFCTEKRAKDRFTSGGTTLMPISRQALMYLKTLSVLLSSELMSAAMNSLGKWALRKAV